MKIPRPFPSPSFRDILEAQLFLGALALGRVALGADPTRLWLLPSVVLMSLGLLVGNILAYFEGITPPEATIKEYRWRVLVAFLLIGTWFSSILLGLWAMLLLPGGA